MENREDPTVSAVVNVSSSPDLAALGRIKTAFSAMGFEVHAPFQTSFSIGAKKSLFETIFDTQLVIDETSLAAAVTTQDGASTLPLDRLDGDLSAQLASVEFMAPPAFPMNFTSPK